MDVWELGDHPNLSCAELSPVIWDLYSKRVSYFSRNTSPFGLVCKMHFQINTSTTVDILQVCSFSFCEPHFFLPWPFLRKNLWHSFVPWSKVAILGMVIQPLIGNPYNGYINPYYWVDDHPLLYGNNGSLDPIAHLGPVVVSVRFPGTWVKSLRPASAASSTFRGIFAVERSPGVLGRKHGSPQNKA